MAARQHSRFVHFVLPWVIAAAGFAWYLFTLNRWVSLPSVDLTAKVAGWDWNTTHLPPVTWLVTWPFRLLPPDWIPLSLNVFAALMAGGTLGILGKCTALLPHDRTREQRQRERSDFSFLSIPTAWIPPAAAAALLAFQLTFWEHATAMTGDILDLTLFAICIYCFLRYRVLQEDKYLAWLAFTFGAAAANDWGMIGFAPLFLIATVWAKGVSFFEANFLIRITAAGIAGLLFYLVQPLAVLLSGQADVSFLELLQSSLGMQRQAMMNFPRWALLFCSVSSIIPMMFIGIRWPSTFGDMSAAGAALTNFMFRLVHTAMLAFCIWNMFDPPFSPRERGFNYPFLRFYFLTALAIGYLLGYVILVFGQEPERKIKRISEGMVLLGKMAAGLAGVAALGAAIGLAIYNFPAIRGQNGPLVQELASTIVPPHETNVVLMSDDNALLQLAIGMMREEKRSPEPIAVNSQLLSRHVYQRHQDKRYGERWASLILENVPDPVADPTLLRQVLLLSLSNQVYYCEPSFGFFFEAFYLEPTNTVYALRWQPTNTFARPQLTDQQFEEVHQRWTRIRERWVDNPVLQRMEEKRVPDAPRVATHYSRGFNTWGVMLQRRNRLEEAARFFAAAMAINDANVAAQINARYNENLRAGKREAVVLEENIMDELGNHYRDLTSFLRLCGPVDEPAFCFKLGRIYSDGNLHRQAAEQFARSLELQPGSTETALWLASSTLNAGLYDDCLRTVEMIRTEFTNLGPGQQTDLIGLESWARFHKGDFETAEKLLLDAERQFPDRREPLQTLVDMYVVANKTNAALAVVEKIIDKAPGDPKPLITKSAVQMQSGQVEEAIQTLSQILENKPDFFPALVNRALAYSRLGRIDDAEKDYKLLLKIAPDLHQVYFHLGEIDFQKRDAAGARRHYRKFLEKAPRGSPEVRVAQDRLDAIASGALSK